MLATLLSWIIISFVLISFGDILITVYQKISKKEEYYNFLDLAILGLCFISLPLTIWSLWLPSNQIFLLICLIISIINIFWQKNRWIGYIGKIKNELKSTPRYIIVSLILFSLIILVASAWVEGFFDSSYYHHQNIRWNEEYAVVPGLGNLDDKYAFNSQYLLISAIFTFRFLFGQAIYSINTLFIIYVMGWLLFELYNSKYEIKRVIILFSYIIFIVISLNFLFDTSTDLLPNIIAFYLIAKIILYPKALDSNKLLYLISPIFLIICKISMFTFIFLSLYLCYTSFKNEEYKTIILFLTFGILLGMPWLARNVILSGYLVYPVYQIDLFSFDWKLPVDVVIKAKEYIRFIPDEYLNYLFYHPTDRYRSHFFVNILVIILYFSTLISFFILSFYIIKKKIPLNFRLIYFISTLSIIVFIINGPDIRFISAIVCLYIALTFIIIYTKAERILVSPHICITVIAFFLIFFSGWTARRSYYNYTNVTNGINPPSRPYSSILLLPYTKKEMAVVLNSDLDKLFVPYELNNNITIYISYLDRTLDILPSTVDRQRGKYISYKCLEARGYTLQEGFRIKKGCPYWEEP